MKCVVGVIVFYMASTMGLMPMDTNPRYPDTEYQLNQESRTTNVEQQDVDGGASRVSDNKLETKILGGTPANIGQFPWQVSNTLDFSAFCGGSVISKIHVLTAAHCVVGYESWLLVFGSLTPNGGSLGSSAQSSRTAVSHKDYNGNLYINDIAIIMFNTPLTWSEFVGAVRLPSYSQWNQTFAGDTARISGWDGKQSQALMFADMSVITNTACANIYGPTIRMTSLCCSSSIDQTTCNGDTGGPLVWQDFDGLYTEIGVHSYGSSAGCQAGHPVVFTRVTAYLDWIQNNTGIEILP